MNVLQEAVRLHGQGLSLIPDIYGEKKPQIKGWQKLCVERASIETVEKWFNAKSNLAVATGYGIVALDFDHNVDGLWDQILNIVGEFNAVIKTTEKSEGYTAFFAARGDEKTRVWRKNGKIVCELLATGRKSTIPPSMHPNGSEYVYMTGKLGDELTTWCGKEDQIDQLFGIDRTQRIARVYDGVVNDEEIERALTYIPADDYKMWVDVGMAIHDQLGDKGYGMWEKWSATGANFNAKDAQITWQSFGKSGKGITIGTLFFNAKMGGFTAKINEDEPEDIGKCPLFNTLKEGETKKNGFPQELLSGECLVFQIANWINSTAIYKQPILSLSSAIACVAAIKAKMICSESYLYTNMYMISVAHSGTGKDHPRKCTEALLRACDLELHVGKEPASGTALVDSLYDSGGKQLINIDEFGLFLSMVGSNTGGAYLKEITTVIMKLFSSANTTYMGKCYARQGGKKIESRDIENPCLSIVGSTTPSALFDALGSKDAINGFLNRFLIMESDQVDPVLNPKGGSINPPKALVEKVERKLIQYAERDIRGENPFCDKAIVLPFSTKAKRILEEFTIKVNKNRVKEVVAGSDLDAIWVRAREHAIKLSMVFADGDEIDETAMLNATDLAYYCSLRMIDIVKDRLFDNQWGKDYTYILEKIKKNSEGANKGINHTKLMRSVSRRMNKRVLTDILGTMLDGGDIKQCDVNGNDLKDGKARYYR